MRPIARPLMLALTALAIAGCGLATDDLGQETGDLTAVGPHATAASVRIVYPETLPSLGLDSNDLIATWETAAASIENVPLLAPVADPLEGNPDLVAVDPSSGIALDVIAPDGVVDAAQLTIVDGAGDDDDEANVEALRAFLGAVGLDADVVLEAVGSDPTQLHEDDQDIEGTYRDDRSTVFYAANEDTVLVGVFGPTE